MVVRMDTASSSPPPKGLILPTCVRPRHALVAVVAFIVLVVTLSSRISSSSLHDVAVSPTTHRENLRYIKFKRGSLSRAARPAPPQADGGGGDRGEGVGAVATISSAAFGYTVERPADCETAAELIRSAAANRTIGGLGIASEDANEGAEGLLRIVATINVETVHLDAFVRHIRMVLSDVANATLVNAHRRTLSLPQRAPIGFTELSESKIARFEALLNNSALQLSLADRLGLLERIFAAEKELLELRSALRGDEKRVAATPVTVSVDFVPPYVVPPPPPPPTLLETYGSLLVVVALLVASLFGIRTIQRRSGYEAVSLKTREDDHVL